MEKLNTEQIKNKLQESVRCCNDGITGFDKQIQKLEEEIQNKQDDLDVVQNSRDCLEEELRSTNEKIEACKNLDSFVSTCKERQWEYLPGYDDLLKLFFLYGSDIPGSKYPLKTSWRSHWESNFKIYRENIEMKYAFRSEK